MDVTAPTQRSPSPSERSATTWTERPASDGSSARAADGSRQTYTQQDTDAGVVNSWRSVQSSALRGRSPEVPARGGDDADVGAGEDRVEGAGELAVPVADQEPELLRSTRRGP